jgi:glutamate formiminotransferase / formiminotetrahydrofolate cyclodeaminase
MKRIVESVPNFSEGRVIAKVDAIVNAICSVPGVYLLKRESDADHNRSVVTLAGEPEAVREAVVLGVGKAAEVIDLTRQTGAHPRIGATDVVPFIPIEGVTIKDCVKLAHEAAEQIWKRYKIPVYLYEAAAQWPERTNLENIRRGQFEGLREEVQRNPQRAPDYGEPRLHPTAGATVVGARKFLIAYNINLATADIDVAKRIAKTVRFSSGGMPCVKAMGVDLRARNLAQVSMNLTDFETTPIHTVYDRVKAEAERAGVGIVGSEIVGLIPRRAIEMTAEHFLKVENFSSAQVFENRLEDALMQAAAQSHASLAAMAQPFIDAVAHPTPAPGGGSVAALAGALAAALGEMVARISSKKKSLAANAERLEAIAGGLRIACKGLAEGIDRDAASYESVLAAHRLPKDTPEAQTHRNGAIQEALKSAVEVPLEMAHRGADVFDALGQLEPLAGPSMLSDVRVGRMMAATAVRGAIENVNANLASITDTAFVTRVQTEVLSVSRRVGENSVASGR